MLLKMSNSNIHVPERSFYILFSFRVLINTLISNCQVTSLFDSIVFRVVDHDL